MIITLPKIFRENFAAFRRIPLSLRSQNQYVEAESNQTGWSYRRSIVQRYVQGATRKRARNTGNNIGKDEDALYPNSSGR